MRIGIIKEGKTPADKRVPFTPQQCKLINARYPQVELVVQKSPVRAFADDSYENAGIKLVDDLQDSEVIFGVKEVNLDELMPNKTYFFFSHTIKKQTYNRELLQTVLERNIKLVDYECLRNSNGERLLGFGRYAGIVGAYNSFLAYGKRTGTFDLKAAHKCHDRAEMEGYLKEIKLPKNYKMVMTGGGRVASGVLEIIDQMGIKIVEPKDFLNQTYDVPVFTQLSIKDYFRKKDDSAFISADAYKHPEEFESDFMKYACEADLYITAHYWDARGPQIFSENNLADNKFRIRTIGDISCDIKGPIPTTIRSSTISEPIYQVNRKTLKEMDRIEDDFVTVMAVDNLPCELPKDASHDFGLDLIDKVLPNLLGSDNEAIIEGATIAQTGELMPAYEYLQDFVDGKE